MSSDHQAPPEEAECQICFNDIDEDTYMEWKPTEEHDWIASQICSDCCQFLLSSGWKRWLEALEKIDCAAAQRRLLLTGPPINLRDKSIFKTEVHVDGHVHKLWFSCDQEERLGKLDGSLEGEARQELWDYQLQFDFPEKEGDEEEKGISAEKVVQEKALLKQLKEEAAARRALRAAAAPAAADKEE